MFLPSYSWAVMESPGKIRPELAAEVGAAESSKLLDVIVELDANPDEATDMATAKEAFERAALPVSEAISGYGGQVLEGAWINNTLRARMPAKAVSDLAGTAGVSAVDVPHAIEPD